MRADRIDRQENVLVDIFGQENDPDNHDVHLSATTMDLSAYGMKVAMSVSVPAKSHLGLRLDIGDEVFRLEGDVRWTKSGEGGFIGIELEKGSQDYEKWVALFENSEFENREFENAKFERIELENTDFENTEFERSKQVPHTNSRMT